MYPTLFFSHGAPNMVLGNLRSKKNFQKISEEFEKPKYIIIISAHYTTKEPMLISDEADGLMYDFFGFEDELYDFKYDIKSSSSLSIKFLNKLKSKGINISLDKRRKTYDHGVWSVLSLMYEKLDIPVLQISLPMNYSVEQLIQLGETLQEFKDEALIICSGGITHNLSGMQSHYNVEEYAKDFNDFIKDVIENGDDLRLKNVQYDLNYYKNHPTSEHFLPLYIAFGSAKNKKAKSFNSEMLNSNISMESFIFDKD